jgi:hypothetical protein
MSEASDIIATGLVKAVMKDPNKELTPAGFYLACGIALKKHWPEVSFREGANWLIDYADVPVGTEGYFWNFNAAKDLAREYVSEFGEC